MPGVKGMRHLQWRDRVRLEAHLNAGEKSVTKLARLLGVCRQTIYKEIKKGLGDHLNSDLTYDKRYYPEVSQKKYEEQLQNKGPQLKTGNDIKLAEYIERKICDENYSPAAVLGELEVQEMWQNFKTRICTTTVYSYIGKGIFLRLTNKDLPIKDKKRKYKHVRRQKRAEAGTSIEKRPAAAESREEFGHWEMDCVVGKRKGAKHTALSLCERKTRKPIVELMPNRKSASVVAVLDALERRFGTKLFAKIFKSITVDNGSEFADVNGLERSIFNPNKKRTSLYYCHPYSSWERGSNENENRMIRRKAPKGTDFGEKTAVEIKEIERWIDNYPRRMFGYHTSRELFETELARLA